MGGTKERHSHHRFPSMKNPYNLCHYSHTVLLSGGADADSGRPTLPSSAHRVLTHTVWSHVESIRTFSLFVVESHRSLDVGAHMALTLCRQTSQTGNASDMELELESAGHVLT